MYTSPLERVTRIELVTRAWKARMLPLHHTRINDNHKVYLPDCQVSLRGLEPPRINSLEPKPSASTNSATATNRPTRTRTWDNRLEGGGYIHLTMGPKGGSYRR